VKGLLRCSAATLSVALGAISGAMVMKPTAQAVPGQAVGMCPASGTAYVRTTLYFGMTHSQGVVSEDEWRTFVRNEVTPRFPEGFTFWTASGQWRRPNGSISHEPAKVLLVMHPESPSGSDSVKEIVRRYKTTFRQDSVLSETARVCAEF
jgi:hypothetical protein